MIDHNRSWRDLLWILVMLGAMAAIFRLWFGLGATTNLTDSVPWGLWKILNMVAGVALATGGFTVGFLVYVLRLERFRPLVKPAILIAFLGYGSSVFALTLDIGLPHRIWHLLVMWNHHSFLFEVGWCVMLYFTVTIMELSPILLERLRLRRAAGILHGIAFGVVVVGISLSSLHHSSLGSLFLVTPQRLHPLWFTPLLPVHFILSAMGGGMMVVVLAKILYARAYDPPSVFGDARAAEAPLGPDFPMAQRLAVIASGVLATYLMVKLTDLVARGNWRALVAGTWESWFFVLEQVLLAGLPLTLIAWRRTRRSPVGIGVAAACAVLGLLWNRMDVGIFGYFRTAKVAYFPSGIEWALSLGVLAAAVLVFIYAVENLPIFDTTWRARQEARQRFPSTFDPATMVWRASLARGIDRVTFIAVFTGALGWLVLYPPYRAPKRGSVAVAPPVALDVERSRLRLGEDGKASAVVFPHRDHQQRLGKEKSCGNCHHLSMPQDHSTPCVRCHQAMEASTDIFNHDVHLASLARRVPGHAVFAANWVCSQCHPNSEAKSALGAKPCMGCHQQDMKPTRGLHAGADWRRAIGYRAAMHGTCIPCHEREKERVKKPTLAMCGTCHQNLRYRERTQLASAP